MAELVDIRIPEEQHEGTELEMGTWLKKVGDQVEKDEPIAELVTDKAVVELPAPCAGVLAEVLVEPETQVEDPSAVLGRIDPEGTASAEVGSPVAATPPPGGGRSTPTSPSARRARRAAAASRAGASPAAPSPPRPIAPAAGGPSGRRGGAASAPRPPAGGRPAPHPAVARLARAEGLELGGLEGTGAGGRVTARDVRAALGAPRPEPSPRAPASPRGPAVDLGPSRRVRHDPMRRAIARNMAESVRTAPHVTAVFECDLGRVIAHREARKAELAERGIKLTFSAYFVRAAVAALRAVPEVNSRWHDDALEVFESAHVGVGTALEDRGLVVPVVRDAQDLDLEGTADVLGRLIEKARAGKLSPAEMRGSTFTLSNHGVMGSLMASPIIIQPPESAILGLGKLERRAVVVEDAVEIRPRMYVTLTIDHRALDAFHTNRFLTTFCETLESWPEPELGAP